MVGCTIGNKVLNVVGFILLAYLLDLEDWGLAGMTYTVVFFANLIQQAGLREVLIRREARFARWATPGFWMATTFGVVAGLFMVAIAPVAAKLYAEPRVAGLVLIVALTGPLNGLGLVPTVQLQTQLRFRLIAILAFCFQALQIVLSVVFAWQGFGAYSFILPMPIIALLRTVIFWAIARPPLRWHPQLKRWRYLIGDTGMMFCTWVLIIGIAQSGHIVLGLLHSADEVGIYHFAFNLSMQTVVLFSLTLGQVLLPALSKLQDNPARQVQAFLRASRLLALLGVPACLLFAATAGPLVRVMFDPKWVAAIPVIQLLSIAMAFRLTWDAGRSLIQAQGRFRTHLMVHILYAGFTVIAVTIGALRAGPLGVAVGLAVSFSLIGPLELYVCTCVAGGRWRDVWRVFTWPMGVGVLSIAAPMAVAALIPQVPGRDWLVLTFVAGTSFLLYFLIIRRLAPQPWHELLSRLRESAGPRFGAVLARLR